MRSITPWARVYVISVALVAVVCAAPVRLAHAPWGAVALFAGLCAACEQLAGSRFGGGRGYEGPGTAGSGGAGGGPPRWHTPVLLAGAFLLPPEAAALVPLPGALLARGGGRTPWPRRLWRAGQLSIGAWTASWVHVSLGGPDTVVSSGFPYALITAGAAVVAFCLVLALLDGGILALAERVPVRLAWRGLFVRSLVPVGVHGLAGLMMAVLWRSPYGPVAALLVLLPMWVSWWVFAQYHRERAAHQATIRALVQAVDIKDGYTRGHSERVGQASTMIARELGMDDERVEVLRFAGILHDVGKLGVPTRLLRKDGPLTPEERRVIELHPEYGHEMVRGIGFLGEARSAILHHHERLDGSGYPYGLVGSQIPEFARVVAVADAFDAMTSTRSYSRARPVQVALAELQRCAGTQFDPVMVGALVRGLERRGGWHPTVTADGVQFSDDFPPTPPVASRARTHPDGVPGQVGSEGGAGRSDSVSRVSGSKGGTA